jgi:hypothetical protein
MLIGQTKEYAVIHMERLPRSDGSYYSDLFSTLL